MRRLIVEVGSQGKSALSKTVIDQVIDQFSYLALVANQSFRTLVIRLCLLITAVR